jgi:hypothetical protein
METPASNANEVYPGRVYPASRPGVRFVLIVAAAAILVIGILAFN